MKNLSNTLIGLGILGILGSGTILIKQDEERRIQNMKENQISPPATQPSYQRVRNYDFEAGTYKMYTDHEIRMMRERQSYQSDGSYIYTPTRVVPSTEEKIEDYLEDNPELIEEYMDKYRD